MAGQTALFEEAIVPVCSPALAADPARPLREPKDLAAHVLLHSDDAKSSWMEWNLWLHAHGLHDLKPAGTLQFNQYDQLVQAAMNGQGVALGRLPLLRDLLRDKRLVTPFRKSVVSSRGYFVVRSARAAGNRDVKAFEAWLRAEAKKDA
jgi:DNA-binding transcriptional LysR family regulator